MKNLEIEIILNLKIGIIFNFKSKFFVTIVVQSFIACPKYEEDDILFEKKITADFISGRSWLY